MYPVIILCGGLGTRVQHISKGQPKSLIEIVDKPFLYWQLDNLIDQGVNKVILCVGYLAVEIERAVNDYYQEEKLEIIISEDGYELLGTGGAVKNALEYVDDKFFVLYGDSYLKCSFKAVQEFFDKSDADAVLTVYKNFDMFDTSNIEFVDGKIVNYDKNPKSKMLYIDYGLGLYRASVFNDVQGTSFDLSLVVSKLVRKSRLHGFEVYERFYEIGSTSGIEDLEKFLLRSD